MRFCGQCGTARVAGARFCIACGAPFGDAAPTGSARSAPESASASAWEALQQTWWLSGSFNVEGGSVAVSTFYGAEWCDCLMGPRDHTPCETCGKTPSTAVGCMTGAGDGVYPVFVLEDAAGQRSGVMAAFEEQWAVGIENRTRHPASIAAAAKPVHFGTITCDGLLLFNDAGTGMDDRNVTVDVAVPAGEYAVIAWLAEMPVLREHGMEPAVRPVALGVYGTALAAALNAVASPDRRAETVEALQPWTTMMWPVLSHREPRWVDAATYNVDEDARRGDQDRATSWLLQAALHGHQPSRARVERLLTATDAATVTERNRLLAMRGQRPT